MTHTKGPWTTCGNGKCKMIFSKQDHIATITSGEWGDTHKGKLCVYGEVPEKQAIANARLIAAAPEMFDLLEYTVLHSVDDNDEFELKVSKLLSKIKG